jgi:hypothetical protein
MDMGRVGGKQDFQKSACQSEAQFDRLIGIGCRGEEDGLSLQFMAFSLQGIDGIFFDLYPAASVRLFPGIVVDKLAGIAVFTAKEAASKGIDRVIAGKAALAILRRQNGAHLNLRNEISRILSIFRHIAIVSNICFYCALPLPTATIDSGCRTRTQAKLTREEVDVLIPQLLRDCFNRKIGIAKQRSCLSDPLP